jgi:hypothetical protein
MPLVSFIRFDIILFQKFMQGFQGKPFVAAYGGIIRQETVIAPASKGLGTHPQEAAGILGIDQSGFIHGPHTSFLKIFKNVQTEHMFGL